MTHDRRSWATLALGASVVSSLTLALLMAPAGALARGPVVLAPPGNSAISQYVEVVPTDRGGGVPRSPGQSAGALTRVQEQRDARLGARGRELIAVVDATSPPPASRPARSAAVGAASAISRPGSADASTGAPGGLSAGPVPSIEHLVLSAATGSGAGGLGIVLPVVLAGIALGVVGAVVRRRRAQAS